MKLPGIGDVSRELHEFLTEIKAIRAAVEKLVEIQQEAQR